MNRKGKLVLTVGLVLTFILVSCGPAPTAPAVTPTTARAGEEAQPTATTVAEMTSEQQTSAGQQVYAQNCARCHGANLEGGRGPELSSTTLSAYGSAEEVVGYISRAMPFDAPGSLSEEEYYDVLAFILDKLGLLPAEQLLNPDTAADILLGR